MELKVLICDDDLHFVKKMSHDIHLFSLKTNQAITIDEKINDFTTFNNLKYDIIFMDIDLALDKVNGIHISEYIRKKEPNSLIIFISARDDLVFHTFKVRPFQFIRKKQYESDLKETLKQLLDHIKNNLNFRIIDINGRATKIYIKNIKFLMSIGNEVTIYCYDSEYTFRSTLKNALELLGFHDLIQIQKSMAVNINHVDDFVKWKIICGNDEYKIGRIYQKDFQEKYERHLLNYYVSI